jgi:cytochrome P450
MAMDIDTAVRRAVIATVLAAHLAVLPVASAATVQGLYGVTVPRDPAATDRRAAAVPRNATSGGMLALAQNPGELVRIQQDPSLLPSAVEEIVRWTSPIIHFARTTNQDVEIRGRKIKKGQHLALFYPSANRDEEIFEDPFTFRVDRHPNRHLGFGIGEHFCAGAHVARLELENAFRYLIPRLEEVEVIGEPKRLRSHLVGGIKHLPIRYRLKPA